MSYLPELGKPELIEMTINEDIIDIDDVEKSTFNGFLYNYSSYHNADPAGTLTVEYTYDSNVTISRWRLQPKQHPYSPVETPFIDLYEASNIQSYYNYSFQMGEFNVELNVDLLVNLPDIEYIDINDDLTWQKQFNSTYVEEFTDLTQLDNNTFRLPDLDIDSKFYILDFTLNYTIEVVNEFSDFWRKDYLVDGTSTRIREFDIAVVDGPDTILASNFALNISEFYYEEFIEVSSNFERPVGSYNMRNVGDRTLNGTRLDFLSGTLGLYSEYYLQKGEVDTIFVKYTASESLTIKIVDKINTPLNKAEVKLNFGTSTNATYGTYISEDFILPYAYKISNSLGMVYYPHTPRGNYTVDVYYQNRLVAQGVNVDSNIEVNIVYTTVPHFPVWIVIFASTSVLIGALGFVILKRAKK